MNDTRKKLMGLVYLTIGIMSLLYGLHHTGDAYRYYDVIPPDYIIFLIPAYALCGITFFFGIKCLR